MFIDFCKAHYQLILAVLVAIISIVFNVIRKRPVKIIDTITQELYALLPLFIRYAEDKYGAGNGSSKLDYVISLVKIWFDQKEYKYSDYYDKQCRVMIENILNTPEKK